MASLRLPPAINSCAFAASASLLSGEVASAASTRSIACDGLPPCATICAFVTSARASPGISVNTASIAAMATFVLPS